MIPMKNSIACATDGAPGMIGKYRGFTAFLTKAIPHVMTIHCVVHWQNLVAKNITEHLNSAMDIGIKYVKKSLGTPAQLSTFQTVLLWKWWRVWKTHASHRGTVSLQSCQCFEQNVGLRDFKKFPRLNEVNTNVDNNALLIFLNHITNIVADIKERFTDLLNLEIPTLILDPFEISNDEV